MTKAIIILLFGIVAKVQAQSFIYQHDYKAIAYKTKDPDDSLYYPRLFARYISNDSTLSPAEVLALLIGFTDRLEYKPYDDLVLEKQINQLNNTGGYQQAIKLANLFLSTHPFDQQAIVAKSYAYYRLGKLDSSEYYVLRFDAVMKAMAYSGSGKAPDSAIFALGPIDGENFIRRYLKASTGYTDNRLDSYGNHLSVIEAKLNGKASIELYFVIQHALNAMLEATGNKAEGRALRKK